MKYLYSLLFLFQAFIVVSQSNVGGRVKDSRTGEPLAFVALGIEGTQNASYSDVDGYFNLGNVKSGDIIVFHLVGYKKRRLTWNSENPWNVVMEEMTADLSEVVIRPGANPAERIVKRAIENREKNNPEKSIAFRYESYNKLNFDIVADTGSLAYRKLDPDSAKQMKDEMESMHLFLVETISKRKYLPPSSSEETIIATKVSGLQNPDFALLGTQMQSFSFYGDFVEILSVKYLSPLSERSYNKYLFIIEDTTLINQDTVFTLSFKPRKGTNFDGMKGQLFINTDGYALQNVLAEPDRKQEGLNIRIQQKYEKVENKAWFPVQLLSFMELTSIQMDGFDALGEARSYMKNIELNANLERKEFSPVTLMMDKEALSQPDSIWTKYRSRELDLKEQKTYHVIDSIGEAENFDRRLNFMNSLFTGRLPIGFIDIDLTKIAAFNEYEGFRLGGGIHTNDKVSKVFSVGGYWAYGFQDKRQKFGGEGTVHFNKKRAVWLRLSGQRDVRETAGNQLIPPSRGLLNAGIYPLFVSRMDQYERFMAEFNGRVYRNISVTAFAAQTCVKPFENIGFRTLVADQSESAVELTESSFATFESGALIRWAPGEKLVRMKNREVRLGGRWPVIHVKYTRGFDDILDGDFEFNRVDATIEKKFLIKLIGESSVRISAGYIDAVPAYSLLYNARGSYRRFGVFTPDAFETMRTNEFQNSQFAALQYRHNFKDLLFRHPSFAPFVVLVHNMMIGNVVNAGNFTIPVIPTEKLFVESGVQLDNLVESGFSTLGIGFFYRYGHYALPTFKENVAVKLTTVINF